MNNKITVISAECVGGYNDTLVYNAIVNINGTNEIFTIERHSHDMQEPSETWEISSKNNFSEGEKMQILEVISKNPPSIFSDVPPQVYDSIDEIEI